MKKMKLGTFAESMRSLLALSGSVFICALLLFWLTAGPVTAADDPLGEAAESFLELVDAGNYAQAWWEGSELLHLIEPLDQWVAAQRVGRELFGELRERSVKGVASRSYMPRLPDGEYGIYSFDVRYENKSKGLELLVLNKDIYGVWRVVSYRLR